MLDFERFGYLLQQDKLCSVCVAELALLQELCWSSLLVDSRARELSFSSNSLLVCFWLLVSSRLFTPCNSVRLFNLEGVFRRSCVCFQDHSRSTVSLWDVLTSRTWLEPPQRLTFLESALRNSMTSISERLLRRRQRKEKASSLKLTKRLATH